uniref:Uncharacterized protein n=1 Tax=Globisporangium ultimum (strain ATCC 200006 / CBS 805.95 / DAOM BR144) TaxID=431595 RepID=K3WIM2_GLOUD
MVAHSSTASSSSTSSSIRSTATSSSSGDTPQLHTINSNEDNDSSAVDKPSTAKEMTAVAPADKDSATTVPDANRCRYKSRKCDNARSIKRNGHLHQLCPYHRDRANQNQRKFDNQKRNWQSDLQKVDDKQVRLSAAATISILSEKSLFARRKIARQARRHCAASSSDHPA